MIEVRDITKEYPAPGEPLRVLRGVSFDLSEGESLVVMGPSGSGKSTLLNIIGTLDSPTSGSILFESLRLQDLAADDAAAFRNESLGFVFQDHHLLPQCTAVENVLLPCLAGGPVTSENENRAQELLDKVGLADRSNHFPSELSGGERQRVAIARSMIRRPRLLLCDEPTGNLDAKRSEKIGKLFIRLRDEENVALIVVTHNAEFGAMFDRCVTLSEGTLHD
ncbi:MAG: ABC transporter ATP-binding protein [Planctomycetes bacterium]|nr:ABC transporter ATP-binding protein [Planctomycetota bacterium]